MIRVAFVLWMLGASLTRVAGAQPSVLINELHYDNASTDVNEAIEVVGPAGTDLTGWSVVLYNGNGGASYGTLPLAGVLTNDCDGFAARSVAAPGLQNGSPDGVALVDGAGTVVQFLSYEGVFTATNGPAAGLTSVDIGVSEAGTEPPTTSLQLTGTGTTYVDFSWTTGGTASFGDCNAGQTFVGGVDAPPAVLATVPVDGAIDVSPFVELSVAFTEDVTTTGAWIALSCSASGNVQTATFDGPRNYRIVPASPLLPEELCTLTVFALSVHDLDGTPDAMVADHAIDFAVAPDTPPTVLGTTPADGASQVSVSTTVQVRWNEPVDVSPTAFGLSCTDSGDHAIAVSGGPADFVLDPVVALGYLETCTLTILAAQVLDRDGTPTAPIASITISFGTEQSLADYYASVIASSPGALRASLHALIDDHVRFPYTASGTDTWDILEQADQDPMNPANILDVYKNASYPKAGGGNALYNREHRWAKSFGFPDDLASSWAYTDTHHLILSDSAYNSARNNRYFDDCPDSCTEYPTQLTNGIGGGTGSYPGNSNWGKGERWEVWELRKGEVARAMLFMDVRYEGGINAAGAPEPDLVLTDNPALIQTTGSNTTGVAYLGLLTVLMQWHDDDPPDEHERLRNALVQTYQGNRNPFVDHPEWAACLFEAVCGTPNQPPSLEDASVSIEENPARGQVITTLVGLDPDAGQSLSYELITDSSNGSVVLDPVTGVLSVLDEAAFDHETRPTIVLVVRVSDTGMPVLSNEATITISVTNVEEGTAIAVDDVASFYEDQTMANFVFVRSNDIPDPDTGLVEIASATQGAHGRVLYIPNFGVLLYYPERNFCGEDWFTYSLLGGSSANVRVTVSCVNDPPHPTVSFVRFTLVEGNAVDMEFGSNFVDPEGDAATFSAVDMPPGLVVDPETAQLTGAPEIGSGRGYAYDARIVATDTFGATASMTLEIRVSAAELFADGFED